MGYGAEQEVNRRTTTAMSGQHSLLSAHSSNLFCFKGLTFVVLAHPPESDNEWPELAVDDTTALPCSGVASKPSEGLRALECE
jgi:hypothetical protein